MSIFSFNRALLVLQLVPLIFFFSCKSAEEIPVAEKGSLDLSGISWEDHKIIELKGEWSFNWGQYLNQNQISAEDFIDVPSIWRHSKPALPLNGFATYSLNIFLGNNPGDLFLEIGAIQSAYELEVNGELISKCGVIGIDKKNSVPEFCVDRILLPANTTELILVMRVSDFHRNSGGFIKPMYIGHASDILSRAQRNTIHDWVLVGFLLFSFLYYFWIFINRTQDKLYLYFSVCSLFLILRLLTRGDVFLYEFMGADYWWLASKIEYFALYSLAFSFSLYFFELFKEDYSRRIRNLLLIPFGLFVLLSIVLPSDLISQTPFFFQIFGILFISFMITVTIRAVYKRTPHANWFLLGLFILIIGAVNDTIYFNAIYPTYEIFNYACLIFILTQAYSLARKSIDAFYRVEDLTVSLEQKVNDRTDQIKTQNKELTVQNIKLEALNKENTGLISVMAHDLRAPFARIQGIINLIKLENPVDENTGKMLEMMEKANNQGTNLIKDLLMLYGSAQNIEPNKKTFDLVELIRHLTISHREKAEKKDIELIIKFEQEEIPVITDEDMLSRVLDNLISNAIKFSPFHSQVEVIVQQQGEGAQVEVIDHGPGIKEEEMGMLFRRFQKLSAQPTGNESSTGLGLSIVKQLLEKLEGDVEVESTVGIGTTFKVTLP